MFFNKAKKYKVAVDEDNELAKQKHIEEQNKKFAEKEKKKKELLEEFKKSVELNAGDVVYFKHDLQKKTPMTAETLEYVYYWSYEEKINFWRIVVHLVYFIDNKIVKDKVYHETITK